MILLYKKLPNKTLIEMRMLHITMASTEKKKLLISYIFSFL